jgi:hypothetical protein
MPELILPKEESMTQLTVSELLQLVGQQLPARVGYEDDVTIRLHEGNVSVVPVRRSSGDVPTVDIMARFRTVLGLKDRFGSLIYTYTSGQEALVVDGHPSYYGVYHPDLFCEGDGVCTWCGVTLVFE